MKKIHLILLSFVFLYNCKSASNEETSTTSVAEPISFMVVDSVFTGKVDYREEDTLKQEVDFSFPLLVANGNPVYEKINAQIMENAKASLMSMTEEEQKPTKGLSLSSIATKFMNDATEAGQEDSLPSYMNMWTFSLTGDTLYLDSTKLSVLMAYSIYTGGAHPNHGTQILNFNLQTGDEIDLEKLLSTKEFIATLKSNFEKNEKEILKEEGYEFNWSDYFLPEGDFPLPSALGFSKDGIYCVYSPYEIASYARGSIEFTVPYTEIKGLSKLK